MLQDWKFLAGAGERETGKTIYMSNGSKEIKE
jgi:hypothetical protein